MAKYLLLRLLSLTRVAMPINQITSTKLSSPSLVAMSRTTMRNPERGSHALTRLMVQLRHIRRAHDGRLGALHESHPATDREDILGAIIHEHDVAGGGRRRRRRRRLNSTAYLLRDSSSWRWRRRDLDLRFWNQYKTVASPTGPNCSRSLRILVVSSLVGFTVPLLKMDSSMRGSARVRTGPVTVPPGADLCRVELLLWPRLLSSMGRSGL